MDKIAAAGIPEPAPQSSNLHARGVGRVDKQTRGVGVSDTERKGRSNVTFMEDEANHPSAGVTKHNPLQEIQEERYSSDYTYIDIADTERKGRSNVTFMEDEANPPSVGVTKHNPLQEIQEEGPYNDYTYIDNG